jgi:succinyl-CoA synthetase alpha subunit
VNPKKAGEKIFDIPIFGSVKEAAQQTGATVSVIYVPPAGAAAAIWEACEADLDLAICITEGIPVRDMLIVRNKMKAEGRRRRQGNPAARPQLPRPDHAGRNQDRHHARPHPPQGPHRRRLALRHADLRSRRPAHRNRPRPVLGGRHRRRPDQRSEAHRRHAMFNDDPDTDAVIMIGEIGGPDEAEAAQWCKANMKKPIVGFIAGVTAPAGKRMGHAGALISGGADTADAKLAIMEECGFKVTRNPSEMAKLLKAMLASCGVSPGRSACASCSPCSPHWS